MSTRFPSLFIGHGSPMNALENNHFSAAWTQIGQRVPKPRAILSVSAHWFVPVTAVTVNREPKTIHDFGGFPEALYQVQYPAPGDPGLARRVQELLSPVEVTLDSGWGLDHGTWSVLRHVYPGADVPVVQLSINSYLSAASHLELGQALAPLREEGVLLIGSGNVVHNLKRYNWGDPSCPAYDWASRFEQRAKQLIQAGDCQPLVNYASLGSDAEQSIPTPEHYLPLLYVLGSKLPGDRASFPVEGTQGGSVSMLSVELG